MDDYYEFQDILVEIHNNNFLLIGFCLGHQLILKYVFQQICRRSNHLIHGRAVELIHNDQAFLVQRYNSWTISVDDSLINYCIFDEYSELAIFQYERCLSFQFHPESVGTTCPNYFFDMVSNFLVHNIK